MRDGELRDIHGRLDRIERTLAKLVARLDRAIPDLAAPAQAVGRGGTHPRNAEALALISQPGCGSGWAAQLGIGKAALYRWIQRGRIPPPRVDRILRLHAEGVVVVPNTPGRQQRPPHPGTDLVLRLLTEDPSGWAKCLGVEAVAVYGWINLERPIPHYRVEQALAIAKLRVESET